jgi:hypothetical protein
VPPSQPRAAATTQPRRRSLRHHEGGVRLFPNTHEGQRQRLAHYEARKLDNLPYSLHDYKDVKAGRETPAERRAREGAE